ncbi:MAG: hypothetical protein KIT79_03295 [Deltaproteobacteria bacterium]|nr:hypothetical protein [Deltaproteobacteria bacterium]
MAVAAELRKGTRVRISRLKHDNASRAWPFQVDGREGAAGIIVTGPFKGDWFLVALDCEQSLIGTYRRFVSVTPDEIDRT